MCRKRQETSCRGSDGSRRRDWLKKGLQKSECADRAFTSSTTSRESRLVSWDLDVSRCRLESVRLSCPADGIKRGFWVHFLYVSHRWFIYALSMVHHCWTFPFIHFLYPLVLKGSERTSQNSCRAKGVSRLGRDAS